ncbi:MAG: cell division protein FtsQ/DivIB, partial [Oscillospiraceae bacterium]
VVLAALVEVGIWLSFTLLFKISGFELQGEAPYPYSVEEVAGVFGLEPGDNMFGFSASGAEKRIETALPYIEEVSVRRKLPSTIVFRVVQAREAYCLPADGGFAVLSDKMKVLRTSEAAVDGLMVINGLGNLIAEVGQPLALDEAGAEAVASAAAVAASAAAAMSTAPQSVPPESAPAESEAPASDAAGDQSQPGAENSEAPPVSVAPAPPVQQRPETTQDPAASFEAMQALLAALAEVGFTEVEAIDVADALDLEMHWGGRITVQLGPKSGLVEKLATALVLLTDDGQDLVAESDKGILDMRYYLDTGQAYFRPQ